MIPARGQAPVAVAPPPPPPVTPDLTALLADEEARVRRRAALAVGRVGLGDGVEPLLPLLGDADPEVRQMAAFALGLIGDRRARDPLVRALVGSVAAGAGWRRRGARADWRPGRARSRSARMIAQVVESGALAETARRRRATARRDTPAAAFRLGVFALVRLKSYDRLAAAVLDPVGTAARALVAGGLRAATARGQTRPECAPDAGEGRAILHASVRDQGAGRAEGGSPAEPAPARLPSRS